MKSTPNARELILGTLGCLVLGSFALRGGVTAVNFNQDPAAYLTIVPGSAAGWRDGGALGDGYLELTSGCPDQESVVVLPDPDYGTPGKAFKVECNLRVSPIGFGSSGGFSISYAESADPVFGSRSLSDAIAHLPAGLENGTQTGVSIGFHLGTTPNPEGSPGGDSITVRIDGDLVASFPTTLATGAVAPQPSCHSAVGQEPPANDLPWASLSFGIDGDSRFHLSWKGNELTPPLGLPVPFFLSEGQLILANRAGPGGQVVDIDNIVLSAFAPDYIPEIGPPEELRADPVGVEVRLRFPIHADTFRAWIDDEPTPFVMSSLSGGWRFRYNSPDVLFGADVRHVLRYEATLLDGTVRHRRLAFNVPPPTNANELRGHLRIFHRPAEGRAAMEWIDTARLYSAPAPTGPWTEVTNATTPYVVPDSAGNRFFRAARP